MHFVEATELGDQRLIPARLRALNLLSRLHVIGISKM
jgi:hypothetical protein